MRVGAKDIFVKNFTRRTTGGTGLDSRWRYATHAKALLV